MRASVCAIPSPVRNQPIPMRASISSLRSPVRLNPMSSLLRASVYELPSAACLDLSPPRDKLDLPAATPSPAASRAAGKENIHAALPQSRPAGKEYLFTVDPEEQVALDLAALAGVASAAASPLFVRDRLYNLYSARRDERLKRKHGFPYSSEWASPKAMAEDPSIDVEVSKRRFAKKTSMGAESVRRSMPAREFAADRTSSQGTRSSSQEQQGNEGGLCCVWRRVHGCQGEKSPF